MRYSILFFFILLLTIDCRSQSQGMDTLVFHNGSKIPAYILQETIDTYFISQTKDIESGKRVAKRLIKEIIKYQGQKNSEKLNSINTSPDTIQPKERIVSSTENYFYQKRVIDSKRRSAIGTIGGGVIIVGITGAFQIIANQSAYNNYIENLGNNPSLNTFGQAAEDYNSALKTIRTISVLGYLTGGLFEIIGMANYGNAIKELDQLEHEYYVEKKYSVNFKLGLGSGHLVINF